jgi:hypothetical protein
MAVKELELKVPTSYSDITLKKWLNLQKDLEAYKDDDSAVLALMFLHLCGLDPKYLTKIALDDYGLIKTELDSFMLNTDLPLQKIIKIDNIEYGFEPNLSQMSYGAYADITKFKQFTINDDWASIMSVLYRPVVHKRKEMYEIETYKGVDNSELFLEVPMDVHFGALFFFVHLSMDLLNATLNSLTEKDIPASMRQILVKNGHLIQHLLVSPMEILQKSTQLPKNL